MRIKKITLGLAKLEDFFMLRNNRIINTDDILPLAHD